MHLSSRLWLQTIFIYVTLWSAIVGAESTPPAAPTGLTFATVAIPQWRDLKDQPFEQRAHLLAGLEQMQVHADAGIRQFASKRIALKSSSDFDAWDFSMQELRSTRSYLAHSAAELGKASPETWEERKTRVALAWAYMQAAYARVAAQTPRR